MADHYEEATESSLADLSEAARLLGKYPEKFAGTPSQAKLMQEMFKVWAWTGSVYLDVLNRTGGPEVILLAREIVRIGKEPKC